MCGISGGIGNIHPYKKEIFAVFRAYEENQKVRLPPTPK